MNLTDALSIKIGTADAVDVRLGSVSVWSGESPAETFLTYDSSSLGTIGNPGLSSRTLTSAHGQNWTSSALDSSIGWWPGNYSFISSTNTTEWLQIDLGENQNVTGVVAQGYPNSATYYVNKYRVEYCIENSIQFSVSGMAAGTSSNTYFNSSTVSHYEVNGTYGGKIQYVASGESGSSIRYRSSDNKWEFVNDGDEYYISDTTNNDNPWAVTSWSVHPGDGSGDTNSEIVLSVDQNTFTDIDSGAEFDYDNGGDGNTKIYNSFATPVTARYITIFPTGYQLLPIMRAGVLTDGVEVQLTSEFSGSSTVDWGDDTTDDLVNNTSVSHVFDPFSASVLAPTYTIYSGPATITENGSANTYTVNTTNFTGTLYWSINGDTSDFTETSGDIIIASNTGTFDLTAIADSSTESSEPYTISIRTDSTSGPVVTTKAITVSDTSTPTSPTYNATASALSVNEGSALTINVATTNVADGTTLYWSILGNTGDFSTTSDQFTINSDAGSFTVTPTADATTESTTETFQVQIRTGSAAGTVVDTTDAFDIYINDTSQFSPDYELAVTTGGNIIYAVVGYDSTGYIGDTNPDLQFSVGNKVTFNNSVSAAHPLYITTSSGSISNLASGVSGAGTATVDWTIPSAGTYYYQCSSHSNMYGQITVTEPAALSEATDSDLIYSSNGVPLIDVDGNLLTLNGINISELNNKLT